MTDTVEEQKESLVDVVRDVLLDAIKEMPEPFTKLSEQAQATLIEKCAKIAESVVRSSCDIIVADGRDVLDCQIHKVGVNQTTYEAKVSVSIEDEDSIKFVKAHHGPAKIAFVDVKKFVEEKTRPKPDADQPALFNEDAPRPVGDVLPVIKAPSKAKPTKERGTRAKTTRTKAPAEPAKEPWTPGKAETAEAPVVVEGGGVSVAGSPLNLVEDD